MFRSCYKTVIIKYNGRQGTATMIRETMVASDDLFHYVNTGENKLK